MAASAENDESISLASLWDGLNNDAQAKLEDYAALVMSYRAAARLTGVKTREEAHSILVMESLALLPSLKHGAGDVADLGSGAGVPGIPLAVALPDTDFTLYERSDKKAGFLLIARNILGLDNLTVSAGDPLEMSPLPKHSRLVTRAALPMGKLLQAARKLLSPGGEMLGFLSADGAAKLEETTLAGYSLLELRRYMDESRSGYVYRLRLENAV